MIRFLRSTQNCIRFSFGSHSPLVSGALYNHQRLDSIVCRVSTLNIVKSTNIRNWHPNCSTAVDYDFSVSFPARSCLLRLGSLLIFITTGPKAHWITFICLTILNLYDNLAFVSWSWDPWWHSVSCVLLYKDMNDWILVSSIHQSIHIGRKVPLADLKLNSKSKLLINISADEKLFCYKIEF